MIGRTVFQSKLKIRRFRNKVWFTVLPIILAPNRTPKNPMSCFLKNLVLGSSTCNHMEITPSRIGRIVNIHIWVRLYIVEHIYTVYIPYRDLYRICCPTYPRIRASPNFIGL